MIIKNKDTIKEISSIFPKKFKNISEVELNEDGYTNISYCITSGGEKYQVKFAKSNALKNLKTKVEFNDAMDLYKYLFIDYEKGITIRHWIDGKSLPAYCDSKEVIDWKQIFNHLKKTHSLPINKFSQLKPLDLYEHSKNLDRLPKKYTVKYKELVSKYENDPLCVSKIDLIFCNIIVNDKNQYYFIDNEWVGIAHEYWDYGELLRWIKFDLTQLDLSKYIKNLDMKKLREYNYMSYVYNYTWTFDMPRNDSDKTLYQKELLEGIKKTYLTIK